MIIWLLAVVVVTSFLGIVGVKYYQDWDSDQDRGAVSVTGGAFGEDYAVPEYLDQGWDEADSLWFYNTTQGSALLPYDFLLVLEQPGLKKVECKRNGENAAWFLCKNNVDRFRYLPQKSTFFNPDALPVGFVKEPYQGKDYVGFTCAACHTAQINFKNPGEKTARALRIDGGPAMADIVGFLTELTRSMKLTQGLPGSKNPRLDRFVERVLALDNDYDTEDEVKEDLEKWTNARALYNAVNDPTFFIKDSDTNIETRQNLKYGHGRLDAFGRIYNRAIQYAINKEQVVTELSLVTNDDGSRLLTNEQIGKVVEDVGKSGDIILRDNEFWKIISNLQSDEPGYPGLSFRQMLLVRNKIFNPPNAPVSYPFLWDTPHSDYVQWNGLASNAVLGPLGRNAGEVIGVFGILDWQEDKRWWTRLTGFSFSALISGQSKKKKQIYFKSSIDLFNLQRLESHLGSLESPEWPFCWDNGNKAYYLPVDPLDKPVGERDCKGTDSKIDEEKAERGKLIFAKKCQICHDVIIRDAWDRLMVSNILKISKAGTDPAMAKNSVNYAGKSGNFKDTYQKTDVGKVIVKADTPVVQILTAATTGVIGTWDADKWFPRRIFEYVYALVMTYFDNQIKASVKSGNYDPDTTAEPYKSLLSYRARSLNGIWATAPYLHNGSVPTLYDLLLPVKCKEGTGDGKYRPDSFVVGAREFDPVKVGFKSEGYDGFKFNTALRGNRNSGHEYGACGMSDTDRWDLIEYLKSL
jgi:cytochrome c5